MFNAVSETAIITLKSRVLESQGKEAVIEDTMSKVCYDALVRQVDEDTKRRVIDKKTSPVLTRHIALRARKYDQYAKDYLHDHPDALIVSLGAGLDTRFWRLGLEPNQYVELDLPDVVEAKKALVGEEITYGIMGQSVLDFTWIEEIRARQKSHILFIAEGLLMYLHEIDVREMISLIAENFDDSSMVLETVNEKYTRGLNKKMVEMKMKNQLDSDAGSAYNFGLKDGKDIEQFHPKIRLTDEWSYFEDPDIGSKALMWLGKFRMFARTQWTVKVDF